MAPPVNNSFWSYLLWSPVIVVKEKYPRVWGHSGTKYQGQGVVSSSFRRRLSVDESFSPPFFSSWTFFYFGLVLDPCREVLDLAGKAVVVGATTDDVDRVCHDAAVERGAYPSPLNYHGFPKR